VQQLKYSILFCVVYKLFLLNGLNIIEISFVSIGARPLSNHFFVFCRFGSLLMDITTLMHSNVKLRTVGAVSERMHSRGKEACGYIKCSITTWPVWSQT